MTAKTFTKFGSRPATSNTAPWATSVQGTGSSQSSYGSPIRVASTIQATSPASQKDAGITSVAEVKPLARFRSTKPSRRLLKLRAKDYRFAYAEAASSNQIATQIRLLREKTGLTQSALAKKLGTRQSAVARLEDSTYGKHSVAMLHRIARIFDVALLVEFAPYSKLLRHTTDLSAGALTPQSYGEEFDENGEPRSCVDLYFDGSVICKSNYVSAASVLIQSSPGSRATTQNVYFGLCYDEDSNK